MQNNSKKKWLTAAVLFVALVPAGYFGTGFVKGLLDKEPAAPQIAEAVGMQEGTDAMEGEQIPSDIQEGVDEVASEAEEPVVEVNPVETPAPKPVQTVEKKPKRELTEEEKELARQQQIAREEARKEAARLREQKLEEARIAKAAEADRRKAEAAEKARLKAEEAERKKAEAAEKTRLKAEETERRKAEAAEKARLKAEEIANKNKAAEQAKAEAQNNLKSELKSIAAAGKKDSRIPEGCTVVLNGTTIDYQAYRSGIRARAFTQVKVSSVDVDANGKAKRITVSAKVQNSED